MEMFSTANHPDKYMCFELQADLYLKKYEQEKDLKLKLHYKNEAELSLIQAGDLIDQNFLTNNLYTHRIETKLNIIKSLK